MDHLKEAKQLLNTWAEHANVEDAKVHALIAIAEQLEKANKLLYILAELDEEIAEILHKED